MTAPRFFSHVSAFFGQGALLGTAENWVAPSALFNLASGFDQSVWLPAVPETMLSVRLSGAPVRKCAGPQQGHTEPGRNILLVPRNTPNTCISDGPVMFGHIYLPDRLLNRASEAVQQTDLSQRLRDDIAFPSHEQLENHAKDYIRRAFGSSSRPSNLEMEGRVLLIIDLLLALHDARPRNPRRFGGLAPWQLRRVRDYMHANLGSDISLTNLADLVGLSAKHFARAFKQSTGLPPHQWMIAQRIERAKNMLKQEQNSISEIALNCGFADQSHLTTAFRKTVGTTPGSWRREQVA